MINCASTIKRTVVIPLEPNPSLSHNRSAEEIETEAKKHGIQVTEETTSAMAVALKAKAAQARALELQGRQQ